MKIAFVGGGTLGPVTPLLAVMKKIKSKVPDAEFLWFGTPNGPERALIPSEVRYIEIPVAKAPRYVSLKWFTFPFKYMMAALRSRKAMREERPDVVVGAGGFTQVPVIMAAYQNSIPSVIHQLDKILGMSNRSVAARTQSVTTSFAYDKEPFPAPVKSRQIPTPVRFTKSDLLPKAEAVKHFGLDASRPVTLVMGGGTGALSINETVRDILDDLLDVTQVIHSTGKGKQLTESRHGYFVTEFLSDDFLAAYSAADVVVSRAGMGSISECVSLGKPMVLVPIPGNQQEANAEELVGHGGAVGLKQGAEFKEQLLTTLKRLLTDEGERRALANAASHVLPTDDGSALAEVVLKQVKKTPAEST